MSEDNGRLSRYAFFGLLAFLLFQDFRILSPFLAATLWAAVLALVFGPWHRSIRRRMPRKPVCAALLSTGVVLLLAIAPLLFLLAFLIKESAELYPTARDWIDQVRGAGLPAITGALPAPVMALWQKVSVAADGAGVDLQAGALKTLGTIGEALGGLGASAAKNTLSLVMDLLVLGMSLFFFFKDGEKLVRWTLEVLPLAPGPKARIVRRLNDTVTAVVRGAAATAAVQGVLAGIGYALAGLSLPVFLGFATALLALVPPFGPALIWAPAALYSFTDSVWKGVFLLAWGVVVVSSADNVLRPLLIGGKVKLPYLLLFFGILGGMSAYGFLGLVLGPLCLALTLAMVQIYREDIGAPGGTE